ncbi:MAG: hypothetical protein OXE84_01225 [Rhodobacteraceae bacterium]|nr:hypothetical protein [Paracoccaceae bacterium]MCY4328269.1 hypothetical protein [Paracoccaceae bacterium]
MTKISESSCLAEWLNGKSSGFACALAARIALRMASLLQNALHADKASRRECIVLPALNFVGIWLGQFGELRQTTRTVARAPNSSDVPPVLNWR